MRYIFLKRFNIKYFLPIKTFFSANNVYFVKNTNNFFKKKKKNFQLSFATNEQPCTGSFSILKILPSF